MWAFMRKTTKTLTHPYPPSGGADMERWVRTRSRASGSTGAAIEFESKVWGKGWSDGELGPDEGVVDPEE